MSESSETNEVIELDGEQSAIVFDADGGNTLYIPKKPDDGDANDGMVCLLLCMVMLDDPIIRGMAEIKLKAKMESQRQREKEMH